MDGITNGVCRTKVNVDLCSCLKSIIPNVDSRLFLVFIFNVSSDMSRFVLKICFRKTSCQKWNCLNILVETVFLKYKL
jgi:hypothetical protein